MEVNGSLRFAAHVHELAFPHCHVVTPGGDRAEVGTAESREVEGMGRKGSS